MRSLKRLKNSQEQKEKQRELIDGKTTSKIAFMFKKKGRKETDDRRDKYGSNYKRILKDEDRLIKTEQ